MHILSPMQFASPMFEGRLLGLTATEPACPKAQQAGSPLSRANTAWPHCHGLYAALVLAGNGPAASCAGCCPNCQPDCTGWVLSLVPGTSVYPNVPRPLTLMVHMLLPAASMSAGSCRGWPTAACKPLQFHAAVPHETLTSSPMALLLSLNRFPSVAQSAHTCSCSACSPRPFSMIWWRFRGRLRFVCSRAACSVLQSAAASQDHETHRAPSTKDHGTEQAVTASGQTSWEELLQCPPGGNCHEAQHRQREMTAFDE